MFAIVIEREELRYADALPGLLSWVQDVGGFAAIGFLLWLVFGFPRWRPADRARVPGWAGTTMLVSAVLAGLGYAAFFAIQAIGYGLAGGPDADPSTLQALTVARGVALTVAGACAIVAAGLPFARNLPRLRWRRVGALAKLSFKEAVRRRVLYAFSFLLLVFLFASWFIDAKAEHQVRTYVDVVFLAMRLLLLFTAALVACFSIPADIRQQTIHTVVTKPVERFEVVLGRFLGFFALMTLVLLFMTAVSLVYVLRGVNPEAAAESLKARVPLWGELRFLGTSDPKKATNVGREWDYRSYITGAQPGQEAQTAVWDFPDLPGALAGRKQVRAEFTFDVYRTTKGEENKGVFCAFSARTWRYREGNDERFRKRREAAAGEEALNQLVEELGYYEVTAKEVTDYHTQFLNLPGGLFRNALAEDPERRRELAQRGEARAPLEVRVRCSSPVQYVGMARNDFYLRLDEPTGSERLGFAANFFKAAFGLWLLLGLVIGVGVSLSTYLSGVISFLVCLLLFTGGECRTSIEKIGQGQYEGGGPMQALRQIARRELTGARPEEMTSPAERLLLASDESFRWVIRRILNVIPDVDRYDLTGRLADGFNIGAEHMLMTLGLLVLYLLPWAVLGFYLIRWREVASSQ
jgi:hypothetical protein